MRKIIEINEIKSWFSGGKEINKTNIPLEQGLGYFFCKWLLFHFNPTGLTQLNILQYNSDTNHMELLQTPQVKGSVLHKTALTSNGS